MTHDPVSPEISAASLAVLSTLQTTMREVRAEAAPSTPGARLLATPDATLGARVTELGQQAAPLAPRAPLGPVGPTPLPIDPSYWRSRLRWLAAMSRRAVDELHADPASRAVAVRALGQVELASLSA